MEDSTFSFSLDNQGDDNIQLIDQTPTMQFEPLHEGPAKIKVIGVGGGGGNAVNHMYRQGIHGVEFIVCNTDAKALESSPVPNKIILGKLGAGNVPSHAREMALAHKDEIRQAISNDTQMLFITAGMGGGTGTGAAPVIAEIAKGIELDDDMVKRILVVAIVTEPFFFEGRKRLEQARAGIEELRKHVDAILVINNDKLRKLGNMPLKEAFSQADDVLLTAAKGIAEIITVSAYVNIDFRDVNTVMENSGTALMGAGVGKGDNRARQAIEEATTSVLLNDNDIRGAQNILLYFSCAPDHQITMDELGEVTDYITDLTGNNGANVIWGIGDDDNLNDELHITLIATGFEPLPGRVVHQLPQDQVSPDPAPSRPAPQQPQDQTPVEPKEIHEQPVDETGIHMVHRPVAAPVTAPVTEPVQRVEQPATPREEVREDVPVDSTPQQTFDNPFDAVEADSVDGKRRITLEMPVAEETVALVEEPIADDGFQQPEKPVEEHNHLDDIRVIKRTVTPPSFAEQPVATPPVATQETQETVSFAEQQFARAMTPQTDDQKVLARAERIRRMNELLRNDPDGPRKIEEMTTEQLSSEPIYQTPHSAESDAARTVIGASGIMSSGIHLFHDLPD